MLNISDFEYWGGAGYCKVSNVEILDEDNKKLVLKADVKGDVKMAMEHIYEDQKKIVWLNGDSIINYPDLVEKLNIHLSPRQAKRVGIY